MSDSDPAEIIVSFFGTPKDRIAVICYFLLGAGLLAPWNAFITATDYFADAFGEVRPMNLDRNATSFDQAAYRFHGIKGCLRGQKCILGSPGDVKC